MNIKKPKIKGGLKGPGMPGSGLKRGSMGGVRKPMMMDPITATKRFFLYRSLFGGPGGIGGGGMGGPGGIAGGMGPGMGLSGPSAAPGGIAQLAMGRRMGMI